MNSKLANRPKSPDQFNLWKMFWLAYVPISVAYQLAWGLFFKYAPEEIWMDGSAHTIVVGKLASELILYLCLLCFLLFFTTAKYRLSKVVVGLLISTIMVLNLIELINRLAFI